MLVFQKIINNVLFFNLWLMVIRMLGTEKQVQPSSEPTECARIL